MNRRNRLRRAALVLALLLLAAIVTGVAGSATKTAIPKQLTGKWEIVNGGPQGVMVVGPRGEVNFSKAADTSTAGWYHTTFSHVTAHRLSVSGPRSCSGTGTYRWGISRHLGLWGGDRLHFKTIHDACKLRVNLLTLPPGDWWGRIPRGARLNPVPLQQSKPVAEWTLRVTSVTPNADGQVIDNSTHMPAVPPSGARFFMLDISVTLSNQYGSSPLTPFSDHWSLEGSHNHKYDYSDDQGCGPSADVSLPMPDLQPMIENNQTVLSGQSVSGNICMQVASRDASTLLFHIDYAGNDVWFSLHR